MKKIVLDDTYCKGCNLCVTVCPKQALKPGTARSKKGYNMPAAVPENCIGCRNCEQICPDFAISVIEEG
jgi:2-oxoglutarate ferredoxin oxidoreductase subunit delta